MTTHAVYYGTNNDTSQRSTGFVYQIDGQPALMAVLMTPRDDSTSREQYQIAHHNARCQKACQFKIVNVDPTIYDAARSGVMHWYGTEWHTAKRVQHLEDTMSGSGLAELREAIDYQVSRLRDRRLSLKDRRHVREVLNGLQYVLRQYQS